jgi:hypothetical protein
MSDTHYAYGKERREVESVMRFGAVKRWHMIDTTRQQTLAEHSANVAALAYLVAVRSPLMFFGPAQNVACHALLHDMPEVFTGDIPSHTKKYLSGIDYLEDTVTPAAFKYGVRCCSNVALMIKICDLVDGIRFIRLHGVDVTAKHAMVGLEAQLKDRLATAITEWPVAVFERALDITHFYAYEHARASVPE